MGKGCLHVKNAVTTFKLDYCCWVAPVRFGLYVIACLNIMISLISIIGIASKIFSPTIMKSQELVIPELPDQLTKPIPILAYCIDMSFNVLLLSATYQKDIVLARLLMYYNILVTGIVASMLVYSVLIPVINVLLTVIFSFGLVFQIYVLILIRSGIVKIIEEKAVEKNGKKSAQIVTSTLKRENQEHNVTSKNPRTSERDTSGDELKKEKERLECVVEPSNEVRLELKPGSSH